MKQNIGNAFIQTLKDKAPRGGYLANLLMEKLCMSKEAIYRRLRGEVPFTIDEAGIVAQQLGISIDRLVGEVSSESLDLTLHNLAHNIPHYHQILKHHLQLLGKLAHEENATVYCACNVLPYTFFSKYVNLFKFRFCHWYNQISKSDRTSLFDRIEIPDEVLDTQQELIDSIHCYKSSYFIWDTRVFQSIVKEIKYFESLQIITSADVLLLKEELYQVLADLEQLAVKGQFSPGHDLYIYLSNIDFDATYCYIETEKHQSSMFRIYGVNFIHSRNKKICETQKDWILSLKRHSTLITQSGEIQRMQFIHTQRRYIDTL